MPQSAIAIVSCYLEDVWNQQQIERVRSICADPIIRHDAMATRSLSHDEQVARIAEQRTRGLLFTNIILHGDDTHVTAVWNMDGDQGAITMSGIEVFKVVDGRITDVWNSTYMDGHWG